MLQFSSSFQETVTLKISKNFDVLYHSVHLYVFILWQLLIQSAVCIPGWRVTVGAGAAGRGSIAGLCPAPKRGAFLSLSGPSLHHQSCGFPPFLLPSLGSWLLLFLRSSLSSQFVFTGLCLHAFCLNAPKVEAGFSFSEQGNQGPWDPDYKGLHSFAASVLMESQSFRPFPASPSEPLAVCSCLQYEGVNFFSHSFSFPGWSRSAHSRLSGARTLIPCCKVQKHPSCPCMVQFIKQIHSCLKNFTIFWRIGLSMGLIVLLHQILLLKS